ncbi:hypothetical protein [Saccharomonospora cyanea]|uniref:Secreted protein n=1 Tax=Saccharomonospora cyanea NA-134 TaxID=882082 RepID=H5XNZ0_9PSEU|nr:hypothetical protein [Saccharomonospora cyanea]EHR63239.1 hypothetical protein SaccyDRAFT_4429 [Saccharomonospora cyanea NA-134]
MFKKTAIVATAAAGMLMLGSPAFATTPGENDVHDNTNQAGLINVDDVLSENQINICPVVSVDLLGQIGLLGGANENNVAYCSNAEATDN